MKKTEGISLIELLVSVMIGIMLITAAALILVWLARMEVDFRKRSFRDMSWIAANEHLKRNIHGSSYVVISGPDSDTLELYNYDRTPIGRYTSTSTGTSNSLSFNTNDMTFENVAATFEEVATRNNRTIEVRVRYTAPRQLASSLVLKCGVDLKGSTWAVIVGSPAISRARSVMQTTDGGYMILADGWSGTYATYLIKLNSDGTRGWSHLYRGTYPPGSISETSNGFIMCTYGEFPVLTPAVTRIDTHGEIIWQRSYGIKWIMTIKQTLTQKTGGTESGFVGGSENLGGGGGVKIYPELCRIASNGDGMWVRAIQYDNPGFTTLGSQGYVCSAEQTFDSSGYPDGYIVGAETNAFFDSNLPSANDSIWLLRFNNTEGTNIGWHWICPLYPQQSPYPSGFDCLNTYIEKVYNSTGAPDGYIAYGGVVGDAIGVKASTAYLLRLDESGAKQWSYVQYGVLGSNNYYMFSGGGQRTPHFMLGFYKEILARNPTSIVEVDTGGAVTSQKAFTSPTLNDTNLYFRFATKENDGSVLFGTYNNIPVTIPGIGNYGIFVAKADLDGICPEAANPQIIRDTAATPINNQTALASFASSTTVTVPEKPADSLL